MALAPTRVRKSNTKCHSNNLWNSEEDKRLMELVQNNSYPDYEDFVKFFPGKTAKQISERWIKVLDPKVVKGSWTREEDQMIIDFVAKVGPKNWSTLAESLPGRMGKQCRERWVNHLDPNLDKSPWTPLDDEKLIYFHNTLGNSWTKIASYFPGRTDNNVKNRWNTTLKKRIDRMNKGQPLVMKKGRKPKKATVGNSSENLSDEQLNNIDYSLPVIQRRVQPILSPVTSSLQILQTPVLPGNIQPIYSFLVTKNRLVLENLLFQAVN